MQASGSETSFLFNPSFPASSATAMATVSENWSSFVTGGRTAAPGLLASYDTADGVGGEEIILSVRSFAPEAMTPSPRPGR